MIYIGTHTMGHTSWVHQIGIYVLTASSHSSMVCFKPDVYTKKGEVIYIK